MLPSNLFNAKLQTYLLLDYLVLYYHLFIEMQKEKPIKQIPLFAI